MTPGLPDPRPTEARAPRAGGDLSMATIRRGRLRRRIEHITLLAEAIAGDCRTGAGAIEHDDDLRRCRIVVDEWGDAAASIKASLANVLDSRKPRA